MADTTEQAGNGPSRLVLAGVSPDRRRLLLVDDQGTEFTLDLTPDLRAAVRGETTRLGQLEIKMTSSIRPREIQIRIRAGETAETVAQAAGTTVDSIMPYVAPVLAEREHVAQRAQKASIRRTPGEGAAAAHTQSRVLGDAVAAQLRSVGADPTAVEWDAYRRETGRWVLTGSYTSGDRSGTARLTYDAPGNYVLADNDDARWLIGEAVAAAPVARDDLKQVRARRLSAVPADELPLGGDLGAAAEALPLGDDALDLVADEAPAAPVDAPAARIAEQVTAARYDEPIRATADQPVTVEATQPQTEAEREAEAARHRRAVQKKRGRASVPSWDEIMFGGSDQG